MRQDIDATKLYLQARRELHVQTDRMFAALMLGQWVFGILVSLWISPRTWSGESSQTHPHVWTALLLGGRSRVCRSGSRSGVRGRRGRGT